MPTFVALLRGINVGKAKRIPMAQLRALLTDGLGYTGVATLLNSGNVVFRSTRATPASHATGIAAGIFGTFKLEVPVVVKSARELAAIVAGNRLAAQAANPSQLLVVFAQDAKALSGLGAVESLVVAPEQFDLGPHAAYLNCANGILESKAGEALLGRSGKSVTTRNWATVLKLQALASAHTA